MTLRNTSINPEDRNKDYSTFDADKYTDWDEVVNNVVTSNSGLRAQNTTLAPEVITGSAVVGSLPSGDYADPTYKTKYDNAFVSHMIPKTDKQYAWITASIN